MLQQMANNYNRAWKLNETECKSRIHTGAPGDVSITEMCVNYTLQICSLHLRQTISVEVWSDTK